MLNRTSHQWTIAAIISFVLSAILGLLLRVVYVIEFPEWLSFINIRHAHSHVAMLGWLFSGLFILIVYFFKLTGDIYKFLFWGVQFTVLGMLVSFSLQGYGLFSSIFTTLHFLLSYVFIFRVFKDLKGQNLTSAILLLKTALILMLISTVGPWALGFIMNSGLKGTPFYYGVIQFFLHFQFNGWMIFAALAIFMKQLESYKIPLAAASCKKFYYLLVVSCILTYALAITWSTPDNLIFWINSMGVLIQLGALIVLVQIVRKVSVPLKENVSNWTYFLLQVAFYCLVTKIVIQTLVAIPYLAVISYTIRNFVVGFIHLLMLGTLSMFIISIIHQVRNKTFQSEKIGITIFLIGFFGTELLLFLQGLFLWLQMGFLPYYHQMIALTSTLLPVGLLFYLYAQVRIGSIRYGVK